MRTTRESVSHEFEHETPHGIVRFHATIEYDVQREPATQHYPNSELGCPASRSVTPICLEVKQIDTMPHGTDDIHEFSEWAQNRPLLYWASEMLWKTTDPNELVDIYEWKADR